MTPRILVLAGIAALLGYASHSMARTSYADLIRHVAPSVVTVFVEEQRQGAGQRAVERATADVNNDTLRSTMQRLLSGPSNDTEPTDRGFALGSGFIIAADGVIVTNRHVIDGARSIRVKLADSREFNAQLIGADSATDIALLRIHANHLPALRLASSTSVSVGDTVLAIGNPFGLGQTVTAGIVSARGRSLAADPYIDFLQTDAAINQGNSGGPLVAQDGTVIGVTTAILSPSGGSVGLGFAIPGETVQSIISDLESHGRVDRGYLGISVQPLTPGLAAALKSPETKSGTLITTVEPDGPSANTLRVGDVILSVNQTPVNTADLGKIMARLKPGISVAAVVLRGGAKQPITLTVGQLPDPPMNPMMTGDVDTWVPTLELAVVNSTGTMRKALKTDEDNGLVVTQLRRVGAGGLAGLRIGDLITHAGSQPLESVAELASMTPPSPQNPLLLRIVRTGAPRFVALTGVEDPEPIDAR